MDELAGLPESVRRLALDRFRLLRPHLEENRPLRQVAIDGGIPYRTAQRWLTHYQQFGLTALARKRRTDIGVHRAVSTKIKSAIEGLALQKPPLPISALYRQVLRVASDLGEKAPCYGVVYKHRPQSADRPIDTCAPGHEGLQRSIRPCSSARGRWSE
jgi:putative transposase